MLSNNFSFSINSKVFATNFHKKICKTMKKYCILKESLFIGF